MYCKNCDRLIDDGVKVCDYCGHNPKRKKSAALASLSTEIKQALDTNPKQPKPQATKPPETKDPSKKIGCGLAVVLLVTALVAAIIVFSVSSNQFGQSEVQTWEYWEETQTIPWDESYKDAWIHHLIENYEQLLLQRVQLPAMVEGIEHYDADVNVYGTFYSYPVFAYWVNDGTGLAVIVIEAERIEQAAHSWRYIELGDFFSFYGVFYGVQEIDGVLIPLIDAEHWG